uniref:Uncharacterized protein n=1 Tax=Anguilla anguilla TaxID=7936 RepID=A0A0E9S4Z5_ANGAN
MKKYSYIVFKKGSNFPLYRGFFFF